MFIKVFTLTLISIGAFAQGCFSFDQEMINLKKSSNANMYACNIMDLHEEGMDFEDEFTGHGVCRFSLKEENETMSDFLARLQETKLDAINTRAILIKKQQETYVHVPNLTISDAGQRQIRSSEYAAEESFCTKFKRIDMIRAKAEYQNGSRTNEYIVRDNVQTNGITVIYEAKQSGEHHTLCYFPKDQI